MFRNCPHQVDSSQTHSYKGCNLSTSSNTRAKKRLGKALVEGRNFITTVLIPWLFKRFICSQDWLCHHPQAPSLKVLYVRLVILLKLTSGFRMQHVVYLGRLDDHTSEFVRRYSSICVKRVISNCDQSHSIDLRT